MAKMTVSNRLERLFSYAAALQQNGRLKNTVYCYRSYVYIVNQDHTVMLRFTLKEGEASFDKPFSFHANDYDSQKIIIEDGFITFVQNNDKYVRAKQCRSPETTPQHIHKNFQAIRKEASTTCAIRIGKSIIPLLDESLSHIEFEGKDEILIVTQRNVFSGTVSTIKENGLEKACLGVTPKVTNFGPIAVRTKDFLAIYEENAAGPIFKFGDNKIVKVKVDNGLFKFDGLLAQCKYDELGGSLTEKEKNSGRKK